MAGDGGGRGQGGGQYLSLSLTGLLAKVPVVPMVLVVGWVGAVRDDSEGSTLFAPHPRARPPSPAPGGRSPRMAWTTRGLRSSTCPSKAWRQACPRGKRLWRSPHAVACMLAACSGLLFPLLFNTSGTVHLYCRPPPLQTLLPPLDKFLLTQPGPCSVTFLVESCRQVRAPGLHRQPGPSLHWASIPHASTMPSTTCIIAFYLCLRVPFPAQGLAWCPTQSGQ